MTREEIAETCTQTRRECKGEPGKQSDERTVGVVKPLAADPCHFDLVALLDAASLARPLLGDGVTERRGIRIPSYRNSHTECCNAERNTSREPAYLNIATVPAVVLATDRAELDPAA